MKTDNHYRQGDVLIQLIDSLPQGLKKIPRKNGRIIVALGSSNGNPHYIDDGRSEQLESEDGTRYLNLRGPKIKGTFTVIKRETIRSSEQVTVKTDRVTKVKFHVGDVKDLGNEIKVDGAFTLLKHHEHTAEAIPSRPAENVGQRGFSRGVIERVQD